MAFIFRFYCLNSFILCVFPLTINFFLFIILMLTVNFDLNNLTNRRVAQLGRALRSGRRGRVFESRRADYNRKARILTFYKDSGLFCFIGQLWVFPERRKP